MSADQVAEIAPLVREVFAAAGPGSDSESDWCATFEVVGNSSAWAQVTAHTLNFAYPHSDAPLKRLEGVFSGLSDLALVAWEPGQFATVSFGPASDLSIAKVVDQALSQLFGLRDYSVDAVLDRL